MIGKVILRLNDYKGKISHNYFNIYKGKYKMKWYHRILAKIFN